MIRRLCFLGYITTLIALLPAGVLASSFPDGTLVRAVGHDEVYMLEKGDRRWVASPTVFDSLGLNWDKVRVVDDSSLKNYPEGATINDGRTFPDGALYRADSQPEVYVIENNQRRWISNPDVFSAHGYAWENIHVVRKEFLSGVRAGATLSTTPSASSRYPLDVIFLETPPAVVEQAEIRFRFAAPGVPALSRSSVTYETLLAGYDSRWVGSGQNTQRAITLTKGGDFVFYVRATSSDGRRSLQPARIAFRAALSQGFRTIKISSVSGKELTPDREQVVIVNSGREAVSLDGWTLSGDTGSRYALPRGEETTLLYSVGATMPITLASGERVVIVSGRSPILPQAFRLNKCLGYVAKTTPFYPAISTSCPKPDAASVRYLASACQEYIQKLPVCTMPTNIIDARINQDATCLEYLHTHLSYAGCLRNYQYDADFFGAREWRAYLGFSSKIWRSPADTIVLRDADGLMVDKLSYK